ncbi:MAG TPA: cysteine hydrolase [Candidatus Acidoferrales bacterium]|nr:cysteine hydrolase [Candidatus Acidoferrales bacterium]
MRKIAFWEVDTQVDFMLPNGKLYVPSAEKIIPNIRRLVSAASENGVFLFSEVDAHRENDPEFQRFPPHCLGGSPGAQIIPEGLTKDPVRVPNDPSIPVPADLFTHSQVVLEKQTLDVFDNPRTSELVERFGGDTEYVVFGVATEYCVLHAAKGLVDRGRKVAIVWDAIQPLDPDEGRRALDELRSAGARLISTDEALEKIKIGMAC